MKKKKYVGNCSECGDPFISTRQWQVLCGEEKCRIARDRMLARERYAKNPEPQRKRMADYRNSERGKEVAKQHREKNKDKKAAQVREWQQANRERMNENKRNWRARKKAEQRAV